MKQDDDDQRVGKLIGEIVKLLPERSKIKTDLLYFKYAPILVMLTRWYVVSQFYDNNMEIVLWYEENEESVWFFYFITYILYPIFLWKGQVLHRLCVEWRIPLLYAVGVNVIHFIIIRKTKCSTIVKRNDIFSKRNVYFSFLPPLCK